MVAHLDHKPLWDIIAAIQCNMMSLGIRTKLSPATFLLWTLLQTDNMSTQDIMSSVTTCIIVKNSPWDSSQSDVSETNS